MSFSPKPCNYNHVCLHLEKTGMGEYRQTAGKNPIFTSCHMWADRMAQVNGNAAFNGTELH